MLDQEIANSLLNQFEGLIWSKDLHGRYTFNNPQSVRALGFTNAQDVIGISDYDIKVPIRDLADFFTAQDHQTLHQESGIKTISFGHYFSANETKMWLRQKSKLMRDGVAQGTHGMAIDISSNKTLYNFILLSNEKFLPKQHGKTQFSISLETHYPEIKVTKKETLCLFYLMRGEQTKTIANILHRSPRTIEAHIDQLKYKTNTSTRSELVAKCIAKGMISVFPHAVMKHHSDL